MNKKYTRSKDIDLSDWLEVDIDLLNEENKKIFTKRKESIDLYFNTEIPLKEILNRTTLNKTDFYRFLNRCQELDENGTMFGYRALIPNKRIKPYTRSQLPTGKNGSKTGSFSKLLDQYPMIKDLIIDALYGKSKNKIVDRKISVKHLHIKFVKTCRELGLTGDSYPFTSEDLAKRSLERYVNKLYQDHFAKAASRFSPDAGKHAINTGSGFKSHYSTRPYQRVQLDGHRIDVLVSVKFITADGREINEIIDRLWLLAIIDEDSRCILGHHICLKKEYSAEDVLHCIRNAIVSSGPKNFAIPGLKYHSTAGFPAWNNHGCEWAVWDEILFDNAKSHLSANVSSCLRNLVGCSINAGAVDTPERRPLIENFFRLFEENGFHRLPNTTGSSISDPKRMDPEMNAIKYQISEQEIKELAEVLIANYNGTPHSGLYNMSPLDALKQRLEQGCIIRTIPIEKRAISAFFVIKEKRKVNGSIKDGRRPYVYYEGAEYRNNILSQSGELIGSKITLHINTEDLRSIKAFLPDGSELGLLEVSGKWRFRRHSLAVRKAINKMRKKKILHITNEEDPIQIYEEFLLQKAAKSKRSRTQLANLRSKTASSPNVIGDTTEIKAKSEETVTAAPNTLKPKERRPIRPKKFTSTIF
ncbi:hypothetical protein [Cytobacillus firmus]|uniref:hypothetical protein n=1 Tax=Cytobacillus firmus TaxID=1399 RepID=UPI001C98DE78|nr:hypothetical protein [Cytobacillus firmus]MBY6053966.1 hypothetical protein [Cytobacillus firmus]